MGKIHILDKAVAELIAAGEVVERPASIVKELTENAIDAGADSVTVEIKNGGIRSIRVSDNGVGIEEDDIPRAFVRHATSKVRSAGDLEEIVTLGFRGEALASIAAVCRVELTTKAAGEEEGTLYRVEGGVFQGSGPAGCPTGATIVVRDIFYNTPARMKFLKKDVTEGNAVAQVVEKCALSHPEVAFQFIRDGVVKLRTSGSGDALAVIAAVYDREFARGMLGVDYRSQEGVHVYGYVSSPAFSRPSRAYQSFFLNGRFVRTRTAAAAVEEAYKNKIMAGKFPACVLNLQVDPGAVDVNVHPAKTEVRFAQEKAIFSAVYFGTKTALQKLERPLDEGEARRGSPVLNAFTVRLPAEEPKQQRMSAAEFRVAFAGEEKPSFQKPLPMAASTAAMENHNTGFFAQGTGYDRDVNQKISEKLDKDAIKDAVFATNSLREEIVPAESGPAALRLIGEAFGVYILLEREGGELLLVDKHAAHERILYEELLQNLSHSHRQVLLTPLTVQLPQEDCAALLENPDVLTGMGFAVEDFGGGTVVVREVPLELGEGDVRYVVCEVADKLRRGKLDLTPTALDRLYYSIACRGAIKAGDKNSPAELTRLVERLAENPQITHCPHGRPVSVVLSRREVEKMFGRLG